MRDETKKPTFFSKHAFLFHPITLPAQKICAKSHWSSAAICPRPPVLHFLKDDPKMRAWYRHIKLRFEDCLCRRDAPHHDRAETPIAQSTRYQRRVTSARRLVNWRSLALAANVGN